MPDKDVKRILREAERQGWRIEQGGKHIKAYPPDPSQSMVTIAQTASDKRAIKNVLSEMRKRGVRWPTR